MLKQASMHEGTTKKLLNITRKACQICYMCPNKEHRSVHMNSIRPHKKRVTNSQGDSTSSTVGCHLKPSW